MRENAKKPGERKEKPAERKPTKRLVVPRVRNIDDLGVCRRIAMNFLDGRSRAIEEKHGTLTNDDWKRPTTEMQKREHIEELEYLGNNLDRVMNAIGKLDARAYPENRKAVRIAQDAMNAIMAMNIRALARKTVLERYQIPKRPS